MQRTIEYWKKRLDGITHVNLPVDYKSPASSSNFEVTAVYDIKKELKNQLESLSNEQGVTLFMTLLAVLKVLLYRYSSQEDICVATPTALFANTLVLRTILNGDEPFDLLLQKMKETTLEAYSHGEAPFEKVVDAVVNGGGTKPGPLYQFMFVLHNGTYERLCKDSFENGASKFGLTFSLIQTADKLQVVVRYSTGLFSKEISIRMVEHYKELLNSVVLQPSQKIGELSMLTKEEERQLLEFNDISVEYPKDKTIIDLFEEQATKNPNRTALVFEEEQLTFRQLNERANQLAHCLRSKGVKEETPVPVCIERSIEMIVAILGILKAGGAYVPIDPEYPEERMQFILEDVNATLLLTTKTGVSGLPFVGNMEVMVLDEQWPVINRESVVNPNSIVAAHQLAYVIYTSGSTGKPKGVMVQHNSLIDYVFGLKQKIQIDLCRSFALVSTISADLGNTVIYSSLAFGGALHVFSKEAINDVDILYSHFQKHTIDCLKIVPSHWAALCATDKLLLPARLIIFGGEALQAEVVETIYSCGSGCRVVNHYGPTETTIGKLLHVADKGAEYNKTVPIGRPFSNTKVYVLTKHMALCPTGVAGELYIAGDGLARGYYNNSGLTRERFVPNPFNTENTSLMYRTGDLVKYLPGGDIQFLGRVDDQVKIHGYRIELGEIESILMQSELVSQAVVLANEDKNGNKRLAAYIVPRGAFDKKGMVSYLQGRLPDYMVPALWVELECLPLTPNGKINKRALPEPALTEISENKPISPQNELEQKLVEIWQDLLEIDVVGIHDNFFELGGDSLLAIRLVSITRKRLGIEIKIGDVFDYPTIAELAALLQNNPVTELEQKLVKIWQDLLEIDTIGIHDNFFELGGDSLLVIRLISIVRKYLETEIKIDSVFDHPTIAELAGQLNKGKKTDYISIERVTENEYYDLSASQQNLWLIYKINSNSTAYNIIGNYLLKSDLDTAVFNESVRGLIARHEALRTVFVEIGGVPKQKILDTRETGFTIDIIDIQNKKLPDEILKNIEAETFTHLFKLECWPIFKMKLVRTSAGYTLVYNIHHIISDGSSMEIFFRDLFAIYESKVTGNEVLLPKLNIQYKDYVNWENKRLGLNDSQREYWVNKLAGAVPELHLPVDYETYTAEHNNRAGYYNFFIDEELKIKLERFTTSRKTGYFSFFVACFKILLRRLAGEDDITIGIAVANRQHDDASDLIGFFINTLLIRDTLDSNISFEGLLQQVSDNLISALENQSYPFGLLLEELKLPKAYNADSSAVSVYLNMQNYGTKKNEIIGNTAPEHGTSFDEAKVDLACYFNEYKNAFEIHTQYRSRLFKAETIEYWMGELISIAEQVLNEPANKIGDLKIFETTHLKVKEPEPVNPFIYFEQQSIEQTIISRFEEQVLKNPGKTAVFDGASELSYMQLNNLLNGLAVEILKKAASGGCNIALLLEHGTPAIIGMLGVLKTGNAYVPLDLNYPLDRLKYIAGDAGCTLIISCSGTAALAEQLGKAIKDSFIINIDKDITPCITNVDPAGTPGSLAYILFTSGSSGEPKGVMQCHRNVLHFIQRYTNKLHICADDRVSLLPAYTFDASVMDIYGALLNGASLYCYSILKNGLDPLAEWLQVNKISIYHTVPTLYRYFISTIKTGPLNTIRLVVLGGEPVYKKDYEDFRKYFSEGTIFINGYGPTESTIILQKFIDHSSIIDRRNIPVGMTAENGEVYLLKDNDEEACVYETGEIVYKSEYVALGYWNKKEQTEKVFTVDPKTKTGRVYRTGDLGIRLPTGEIELVARKDTQVKIRGQRVELSEIEQNIIKINGVEQAAVVPGTGDYEGRLIAYIRYNEYTRPDENDVKQSLTQVLPAYMVPSVYVSLKEFPLTNSGKINRRALPAPTAADINDTVYTAPRTQTELKLADIWRELLKVDVVGIHDNFFELGGHSMLAVKLIAMVEKASGKRLPVSTLFEHPTIGKFANLLKEDKAPNKHKSLVPVKAAEGKEPLYIVSGINGTAFAFVEFANMLDPNQPVFVLQQPQETSELEEFPGNVEGIAATYVDQILEQNPNGPYAIAGHCFGGIIAFEMAKQLEIIGKEVKLIALFDTYLPQIENPKNGVHKNIHRIKKILQRALFKSYKNIHLFLHDRELALKYRKNSFMKFTGSVKKKFSITTDVEKYEFSEKVTQQYRKAIKDYQITPYNRHILLYRAKMASFKWDDHRYLGWKLYTDELEIHEIKADHLTMLLSKDFAALVQENLNQYLNN